MLSLFKGSRLASPMGSVYPLMGSPLLFRRARHSVSTSGTQSDARRRSPHGTPVPQYCERYRGGDASGTGQCEDRR